jgi:hypothetical protein
VGCHHRAGVLVVGPVVRLIVAMQKRQKRAGGNVEVTAGALPRSYPFFTTALSAGLARS